MAQPTVLASCYTVEAGLATLKFFHYSTTALGGKIPFEEMRLE